MHVGPLSLPDHRGDAINEVWRLLDSQFVRLTVARASSRTDLVTFMYGSLTSDGVICLRLVIID
ncbi:hypothetical protein CD934_31200 [Streptomyces calvus]|uniref:Uncharacterized protein n=1 Tax=Streptomyces calvus TaxID=67282 RepID=A0A514JZ89_9ACTN|nr:hypothetical protein CD934_31200 [Streptomyces calvus]